LGSPFDSSFDEGAYLDMMASVGISHNDGRPRLNGTLAEILDMDFRLFMHLYEEWKDRFSEWKMHREAQNQ
jgi:hypothetical protein